MQRFHATAFDTLEKVDKQIVTRWLYAPEFHKQMHDLMLANRLVAIPKAHKRQCHRRYQNHTYSFNYYLKLVN